MERVRRSSATGDRPTFRILSIDGGGIRGVIPGQILVNLEAILQKKTGNTDARIADFFDLIAGTSTGGLLACAYLVPGPGGTRPKFSAQEAVELYLKRGGQVFDLTIWQKIRSGGGLTDEKYSASGLEGSLKDYFGDLKLSDLLKPSLITAYDIRNRKAHFFRQHLAVSDAQYDFLVRSACRATSAAPTYFEAAKVKSMTDVPYALIDGGVCMNNPAMCAYAEARTMPQRTRAKDMLLLSIGTGEAKKPYHWNAARNWGMVQWIKPVLEIMMSGVAETVDYQLRQMFDAVERPAQYLRLTPQLGDASAAMDDASPKNLKALRNAGQFAAESNWRALEEFADRLIALESGGGGRRAPARRNGRGARTARMA